MLSFKIISIDPQEEKEMLKLIISDANGLVLGRPSVTIGSSFSVALPVGAANARLINVEDQQCFVCLKYDECASGPNGEPICESCHDSWAKWFSDYRNYNTPMYIAVPDPNLTEEDKARLRAGIEKAFAETDGIPGIVNRGAIHIPITVPKIECIVCGHSLTDQELDLETCYVCHPPAPYAPPPPVPTTPYEAPEAMRPIGGPGAKYRGKWKKKGGIE